MGKIKIGDFVQVKKGIKEFNNPDIDISNWSGQVKEVNPVEDDFSILVAWDVPTIKKISQQFVIDTVEEGGELGEYYIYESDVEVLSRSTNMEGRDTLLINLEEANIAHIDDEGKLIADILGTTAISVNEQNLNLFRQYILENLEKPVYLTGREVFPWEERYFFGSFSKNEHKKLRKTRPSYKDTFRLLNITLDDDYDEDLFAKVKRKGDAKVFEIKLSWLEATDKDSDNYGLLELYSMWAVNY